MKTKNQRRLAIAVCLFALVTFVPSISRGQVIFTLGNLANLCANVSSQGPGARESYLGQYGYYLNKSYTDANHFADKFGNSLVMDNQSRGLVYHVRLPDPKIIHQCARELQAHYESFTRRGITFYFRTKACVFSFERKGDDCVVFLHNSSDGLVASGAASSTKMQEPPPQSSQPQAEPPAPDPSSPPATYDLSKTLPKTYKGYIINTTEHKKSFSVNTLSVNKDGSYRLKGNVDNINLSGRWDLVGYETPKGSHSYQFMGNLDLGGTNNFPAGTKAPFTITVQVDGQGMKGTYEIGTFRYSTRRQEGTIDLQ